MPAFAVLLVVASAFLHAGWNALLKHHAAPDQASTGVAMVCALVSFLVAAATAHGQSLSHDTIVWSIVAGICEAAYFWLLGRALARSPLSLVYVLARGGAVLVVWPLSAALAHEPVTILTICGALLLCAGMAFTHQLPEGQSRAGAPLALLTACCIAGNHVCYKQAILAGGQPATVFAIAMAISMLLNLPRFSQLPWRPMLRDPRILAAGSGACLSFLLALRVMDVAGAGVVLSLRNLSIPLGVLLALAMGEKPGPRQWLGAAIITLGAVLIAWSSP